MTWNLSNNIVEGHPYTSLTINTKIYCTITSVQVFFVVKFLDVHSMKDDSNNTLATPILQARAFPFTYISDAEAAALSGSGGTFSASSFITFAFCLGISLFQGAAIGSFWAFVNMLQIIAYLPVINCYIPYNLEYFLTNFLQVSQVTFPWSMIPNWIPNPLALFVNFLTPPLNLRFQLCGYQTLSFIYNFASQLLTWITLLLIYILLRIIVYFFPKPK